MRFRDLVEAPIEDLSVVGDVKPGEQELWWTKQDVRQIEKLVKKREIWKENPYKFVQVLFMPPSEGRGWRLQEGPVTKEELKEKISSAVKRLDMDVDPEALVGQLTKHHRKDTITIIHGGNEADIQYMPMTSWILAHRSAHAMIELPQNSAIGHTVRYSIFPELLRIYDQQVYGEENDWETYVDIIQHQISPDDRNDPFVRALSQFFTFSSARKNKVVNDYELFYDIISQFIVTGRVKINVNLYDNKATRAKLQKIQNALNKYADRFVRNAVGRIFLM